MNQRTAETLNPSGWLESVRMSCSRYDKGEDSNWLMYFEEVKDQLVPLTSKQDVLKKVGVS